MVDNIEYEGQWWLPENETQKFHGKLTVSQGKGGKLCFRAFDSNMLKLSKADIILGISKDGKKITLYKCVLLNLSYNGSAQEYVFISTYVFVGALFNTTDQIAFKCLYVRYLNLETWVNTSGFKINAPKNGVIIRYRSPQKITLNSGVDFEISVAFSSEYPTFTHPQIQASVTQKSWIEFSPKIPKRIEEYLESVRIMQNFLTLSITKPTAPIGIEGQSEIEVENLNGQIYYPIIQVFVKQSFFEWAESVDINTHHMLFTLKEIMRKRRVIKNWFERHERLKPATDLYFSTIYNKQMYDNNEFLNLAQALETYHRRTMKNSELPNSKHKVRVQAILKKTPEKYKKWLQLKLNYSNEPILRKRIKDICDKLPISVLSKVGNINKFVSLFVDTRNYWTHFDEAKKTKAAWGVDLQYLIANLRLLLVACFLNEIGFTNEEVDKLLSNPFVTV